MKLGDSAGPLWVEGNFLLRVTGPDGADDRAVRVARPYAIVGRVDGADVRILNPAVSTRHAYLHLDRRGVFAVDLISRTGTRIRGEIANSGWLRPGDSLEVAGTRIELLEARIDGEPIDPPHDPVDPLGEDDGRHMASVSLTGRKGPPWVLGSQLAFLGRSEACAVRVEAATAARVHCVLVRDRQGVHVVDLIGRLCWLNHRPVRGAAAVHDGDLLTVGSVDLVARVQPWAPPRPTTLPAPTPEAAAALAAFAPGLLDHRPTPGSPGANLAPDEMQAAFLTWLLGMFQAGQGELVRRQNEFQLAMSDALREIQRENSGLLREHLKQIQAINRELVTLRAEVQRLERGPGVRDRPPADSRAPGTEHALPKPPPLKIPPAPPPSSDPGASTTWLLQRIGQLEEQNRSSWRDLLGRLSPSNRDRGD